MPALLALFLPLLKPLLDLLLGQQTSAEAAKDKATIDALQAEKATIAENAAKERNIHDAMRLGYNIKSPEDWKKLFP